MKNTTFNLSPLAKAFAMTTAVALSSQAFAQEETEVKEKDVEKIQVTGSLGSLPGQDVESVFWLWQIYSRNASLSVHDFSRANGALQRFRH